MAGLISNIVGGITGSDAAKAASAGGKKLSAAALEGADLRFGGTELQAQGGRDAFDFLNKNLSPFAGGFNAENIQGLNALATDSQAQADYLQNNPLFDILRNQAKEDTFRQQSAGGALGSLETDKLLQNSYLALGNDLIDKQINRQLPLLQSAQGASTNLGTGGADLLNFIGSTQAQGQNYLADGVENSAQALVTGEIGKANAYGAGAANLLGGIGSLFEPGGEDGKGASKADNMMRLAGLVGLSDIQLKKNIEKIGNHNGLNVYSWEWNDIANGLGVSGKSTGHIAQEVNEVYPELIGEHKGFMTINYGTDKTVNI